MAAIERGEGAEDRVVRGWLARAVTASRGSQWVCGNCGHVHEDWRPVCSNCESFDTLDWSEVRQSQAALAGPAQMLPLIVGALEDHSDADDAEVVVADVEAAAEDAAPIVLEEPIMEDVVEDVAEIADVEDDFGLSSDADPLNPQPRAN
jgi:HemY protein